MAVFGGLEVDWPSQIKLPDDHTWSEVKVFVDDFDEFVRGAVGGSVGIDEDRKGLSNTDGVGELHKSATGELGVYKGLGDPACEVGR